MLFLTRVFMEEINILMWNKCIRMGKNPCSVSSLWLSCPSSLEGQSLVLFISYFVHKQLNSGLDGLSMFMSLDTSLFLFFLCLDVVSKRDFTKVCYTIARLDGSIRMSQSQDLNQWSTWPELQSHRQRPRARAGA